MESDFYQKINFNNLTLVLLSSFFSSKYYRYRLTLWVVIYQIHGKTNVVESHCRAVI